MESKEKKKTLKQYYATRWWREFREKIHEDKDLECEICKKKKYKLYKIGQFKGQVNPNQVTKLVIHHKHYNTMYKEQREDVIVLCNKCHDVMHALHNRAISSPEVYGEVYEKLKNETVWEHEKRSSK